MNCIAIIAQTSGPRLRPEFKAINLNNSDTTRGGTQILSSKMRNKQLKSARQYYQIQFHAVFICIVTH